MTDAPTPPEPIQPDPNQSPTYPTAPPVYNPTSYGAPARDEFHQPVDPAGLPTTAYAHWGQRVAAYLVDSIVPLPFYAVSGIGIVVMFAGMRSSYDAAGNEVLHINATGWIGILIAVAGYLGAIAFAIWNIVFRQGRTGWSIGKKVMGIRLVNLHTGQPMGAGLCFVRQLAHFVDGIACYIGYLWPLWDERRQTFADKIMSTVVVPAAEPKK